MSVINTDLRTMFEEFQARNPKPYFRFEDIPTSERLYYEKISTDNYREVFSLFEGDDNPFLSEGYRSLERFEAYLEWQLFYLRYTPKQAACDWLMRLRSNGQCIGIVNVFDLCRKWMGPHPERCMIGFSTHRDHRRQYYTFEAVTALTQYVFTNFEVSRILANVDRGNAASRSLLLKLGFESVAQGFPDLHKLEYFRLERPQ